MSLTRTPTTPAPPWKTGFVARAGFWGGVILLIHLLPKDPAPASTGRLLMTAGYFTALVRLGFLALEPRCDFLKALYAWKYEDAPPAVELAWRRWLDEIDRVVTFVTLAGLVVCVCWGLSVFDLWFGGLDGLTPFINLGWWLAVLGLGWYLWTAPFREVALAGRALRRQLAGYEAQGYRPRRWSDLWAGSPGPMEPVAVLGPGSFRAGGIDWDWSDFRPNCAVFGKTRTGKTVCVLNAMLDGLLGAHAGAAHPLGALVMDPKGDFLGKIRSVCRKWGRERDLRILDLDPHPAHPAARWNPLDSAEDEFELAERCGVVMETLGTREANSSYWIDSSKQYIAHAIMLLRLTADEPPSYARIGHLATHPDALKEAIARLTGLDRKSRACMDYFADVWFAMDSKLRTDLMTFIRNLISPFQRDPYAGLFSGRSTESIGAMIDRGAILYLHMPTAREPRMSRTIGTFVKYEYQLEILRRCRKPGPSVFLCDEFSDFVTFGEGQPDATFFAKSAESNHANIVAAQNLNSFLMRSHEEAPVLNLLGNCGLKVFLRNDDARTNQYASEPYGVQTVEAQSTTVSVSVGRRSPRSTTTALTGAEQERPVVRPDEFARLKIPGSDPGAGFTEAVVYIGSRPTVEKRPLRTRWPVHPL